MDDLDTPCHVCGHPLEWIECDTCNGEGGRDSDELMEEDPLWYDGVEWEDCSDCHGDGGWWYCDSCKRVSLPVVTAKGAGHE